MIFLTENLRDNYKSFLKFSGLAIRQSGIMKIWQEMHRQLDLKKLKVKMVVILYATIICSDPSQ